MKMWGHCFDCAYYLGHRSYESISRTFHLKAVLEGVDQMRILTYKYQGLYWKIVLEKPGQNHNDKNTLQSIMTLTLPSGTWKGIKSGHVMQLIAQSIFCSIK